MSNNVKTHWKKNFNYEYLGSYSLPQDGSDLVGTIKEVKIEKVIGSNGKKEECLTCSFSDLPKPMILNRTNCKIIESIYNTPFTEEWVGKKISLYKEKVSAFGTMTEALRIRPKAPVTGHVASPKEERLLTYISKCKTLQELAKSKDHQGEFQSTKKAYASKLEELSKSIQKSA